MVAVGVKKESGKGNIVVGFGAQGGLGGHQGLQKKHPRSILPFLTTFAAVPFLKPSFSLTAISTFVVSTRFCFCMASIYVLET